MASMIDKTVTSKYQPKSTNVIWVDTSLNPPVEKHFVNGRWKSMGGGVSDYSDIKNKPTINGVELDGNKTSQDLGVYSKPLSGIPESDLSLDVQQALQKHFKGWYDSSSNLPTNPVIGDYAYVKGAESTDPAAIYECTTDGSWSDSGRTVDTSNVQTFASGEEVNEVHIVNDCTTGGVDDVLSAEQGRKIYSDGFYTQKIKDLGWNVKFNGTSSMITFNSPIVLSTNGDSIEIECVDIETVDQDTGGYQFMFKTGGTYHTPIGISQKHYSIRADDGTWIRLVTGAANTTHRKIKVVYDNDKTYIYSEGILAETKDYQKQITIDSIGSNGTTKWWKGCIKSLKLNGVEVNPLSLGICSNVSVDRANYFLTDEQVNALNSAILPKFVIVPEEAVSASEEDRVQVYFQVNGNVYGRLPIGHAISDTTYANLWRICTTKTGSGKLYSYSFGVFAEINNTLLLNTSENEFAIQFSGMDGDFTGGAHGDERIDVDENCYAVFIVDGEEYSFTELLALGAIQCEAFEYRQKSMLYTDYNYLSSNTHYALGYHIKRTVFGNRGYTTDNIFQMDLGEVTTAHPTVTSLNCMNAYAGLVCVSLADEVVNDMGVRHTLEHPSTSHSISGFTNLTDKKIKFFNTAGDFTCEVDSGVVYTNIASWKTGNTVIDIWDRQIDGKYYNRLPQNVDMVTDNILHFTCNVQWNYRR